MSDNTIITPEQAWGLLSAPSGQRPRIYGVIASGECAGQLVALTSQQTMDKWGPFSAVWLSGTTVADLIGRA